MAIGFGATKGVATTDKIDVAASTFPAQFSMHVWANRNGEGGGGLGRILDRGSLRPMYIASTSEYGFTNGNNCFWRWNRPSAGIWTPLGLSVDSSNAANDPIVYQSGAKLTVGSGITQINADSAYVVGSAVWTIGARTSTGVGWDGSLAEIAWWNAILTDEEFYALQKGISPEQIRPDALQHYFPLVRVPELNKKGTPGVVTGTAVQPHPAIIRPRRSTIPDISVSGSTTYTLSAESGSFPMSGSAASLKYNRKLSADSGNFPWSGQAAALRKNYKLAASPGNFPWSGSNATLIKVTGYLIVAASGNFPWSGTAANLRYTRRLNAESGSFGFSGQDATLTYNELAQTGWEAESSVPSAWSKEEESSAGWVEDSNSSNDWSI